MITLKQYLRAKELLDEYHEALGREEEPDFPQEAQDVVNEWSWDFHLKSLRLENTRRLK